MNIILKFLSITEKVMSTSVDGVILSGGCALNCPANASLANILGGTTRNAVIGKAHRLNLSA